VILIASLLTVAVAAPVAGAGTAVGALEIHTAAFGPQPARDARYQVSGTVQTALAMSAQLGPASPRPDRKSVV